MKALDDSLGNAGVLETLGMNLGRLRDLLASAPRQLLVVSEAELQHEVSAALAERWQTPPPAGAKLHQFPASPPTILRQGWATNTQVNFCATAYPTVASNHGDAPALAILGDYLRNGFLHREIREQGGAYGAGAGYHGDTGTFRFFSYRDPQLEPTLKAFEHSVEWLLETQHTRRSLEEAILGVVAAIDRPGSPAGEAIGTFLGTLFGRSPVQRRHFRQCILGVTMDDLRRVAERYLSPSRASVCVVSDSATLDLQRDLQIHKL
jgi:Zn-dependent M16 (insulinase) family peptidase